MGFVVRYNHKYYYLSRRAYTEMQDHVFRIFEGGFGIDRALLNSIILKKNELFSKIEGIIIFYEGKNHKRYFYADLDTWIEFGENYSTSKLKENYIETYGEQKILKGKYFELFGLHPDDVEAKEVSIWN